MNIFRTAFFMVMSAGSLCLHSAQAATNSAERVAAWSKLPDWSGIWEMGMGAGGPPGGAPATAPAAAAPPAADAMGGNGMSAAPVFGPREDWPFSTQGRAKNDAMKAMLDKLEGTEQMPDTTVTECTWGFPRVLSGPYQFEVKVTPELTFFDYDIGEFRHIWTDGRQHPAKLTPSGAGHSIGHWDNDTLVVDTVGTRGDVWITGEGMTLSDKAHFTERWKLQNPNLLTAEVTIDDPVMFTKPYVMTRQFKRVTDSQRLIQQNCFENVHEVQEGGKVITKFSTSK